MNCAEKLLDPTIFPNPHTKPPHNSGPESPQRKRDPSPTCNLDIKPQYCLYFFLKKSCEAHDIDNPVQEASELTIHCKCRSQQHGQTLLQKHRAERHRHHRMQSEEHKLPKNGKPTTQNQSHHFHHKFRRNNITRN